MQKLVVTAVLALIGSLPAGAATPTKYPNNVDLELVLAVDVSGSMDLNEQRVQREGYVAAFRHPDVIKAITGGGYGRVAVTYVEWSSAPYQVIVMPWRILASQEDALQFADDLEQAPINREGRTSISGALLYASTLFPLTGLQADRRTVDMSGDGANNDGDPVVPARGELLSQGITINGLPILINPSPMAGNVRLDDYYHDCVIGGPGSFMVSVTDQSQFETAIRRKLVLEIASNPVTQSPAVQTVQLAIKPSVDCLVGERSRALGFPP